MKFEIEFFGHKNIRSLHQKTIEITKEENLTPSGDCIIGVNANHACYDIPDQIKEELRKPDSKIKFSVIVNDHVFEINGVGHKDLELTHSEDIVIRKSDFICPRTMAVKCDKASDSIPRLMIKLLQNPSQKGIFRIEIN